MTLAAHPLFPPPWDRISPQWGLCPSPSLGLKIPWGVSLLFQRAVAGIQGCGYPSLLPQPTVTNPRMSPGRNHRNES